MGKSTPDVDKRIKAARRAAYSMMGVGLHGHDGVELATALKMVTAYITPRLLHGMEAAVLKKEEIKKLDGFYRRILRQIQGLPESTAGEAVYMLIGASPIESTLHRRILSLFGSVTRLDSENPVRTVALRQLACKDDKSSSWFTMVAALGRKYNIDVRSAVLHPWPKLTWKRYTNQCITEYWTGELYKASTKRSTMRNIIPPGRNGPHQIWTTCKGQNFHIQAATVRARMLVGRYFLQSHRAKYGKGQVSATCKLCEEEDETLHHFLYKCKPLEAERTGLIAKLKDLYVTDDKPPPAGEEELVSAILNGGGL